MEFKDVRLMLDMVDSGVIMLDKDQRIVFWNQFISETSKLGFDFAENKYWLDIFPSLQDSRIEKAINKATELNFPSILSYKLLKTTFPLYKKSLATRPPYLIEQSIVIKPITENKKNAGCIIYINDVSSSAKREKDLNNQALEIKNAMESYTRVKSQFEDMFNNAHDGIVIFDCDGTITNANEEAHKLFLFNNHALIDRNIASLLPELKERYFSEDNACYWFDPSKPDHFEQALSKPRRHFSVSISHIRNQEQPLFFVFISDMTKKQTIEEELREANSELEAFSYHTSHDLRSPVVSSINLLNIAQKNIGTGNIDTAQTCLSHAEKSLKKLEILIKDILTLAENKNREVIEEIIDLSSLIEDSKSSIAQLPGFEDIHYELDLQHKKSPLTQKQGLQAIIDNLLSNSVKYQNPEEDEPYIRIQTSEEDNQFIIDILDNGLGIPEEQEHKIFQMFNRFHPKTAFGSGLGLYLVKKSALSLGGDVHYIPQDKGCCFRVTLPQQLH